MADAKFFLLKRFFFLSLFINKLPWNQFWWTENSNNNFSLSYIFMSITKTKAFSWWWRKFFVFWITSEENETKNCDCNLRFVANLFVVPVSELNQSAVSLIPKMVWQMMMAPSLFAWTPLRVDALVHPVAIFILLYTYRLKLRLLNHAR